MKKERKERDKNDKNLSLDDAGRKQDLKKSRFKGQRDAEESFQ
jgi:hypothetical protein